MKETRYEFQKKVKILTGKWEGYLGPMASWPAGWESFRKEVRLDSELNPPVAIKMRGTFSGKVQIVNISDFIGHKVFVATTQLVNECTCLCFNKT